MARTKRTQAEKKSNGANLGFEAQLWAAQMAESAGLDDQIRKNLEGLGYGF
jgi:hypothetical protein